MKRPFAAVRALPGEARQHPLVLGRLAGADPAATGADRIRARRLAARVNVSPGEDDPHPAWLRHRAEGLRTRDDYWPALHA